MRWTALVLVAVGCGGPGVELGQIGPLDTGWSTASRVAECSAPDVAPRLHFARVSDLSWMSSSERVLLAGTDIARTRGADTQALDRLALDGAMRVIAPMGLEAAHAPELAARLRSAPPIRTREDVQGALMTVERMETELLAGSRGRHLLDVLARGLRESLDRGFPETRCAYIVGHGTIESEVAAAAIAAGASRERVAEASVDLLSEMAAVARTPAAERAS